MVDKSACAKCKVNSKERACSLEGGKGPEFCPTLNQKELVKTTIAKYLQPETLAFAQKASIQEAECYAESTAGVPSPEKPRLQEVIEFARRMGYKRLGLAFCAGLAGEAAVLQKVLEKHGFNVVSVICKVGCTPKEHIGIKESQKISRGEFEPMCSPLVQAEVLNEAGTEFNVLLGLCIGHDSLFFKHAQAPTTVFAVKDRVLGHNPLAAIYTIGSYYRRLQG